MGRNFVVVDGRGFDGGIVGGICRVIAMRETWIENRGVR